MANASLKAGTGGALITRVTHVTQPYQRNKSTGWKKGAFVSPGWGRMFCPAWWECELAPLGTAGRARLVRGSGRARHEGLSGWKCRIGRETRDDGVRGGQ